MSVALYRKYRSKTFDELIGQEHIRVSLGNALKQDRISHAYLFCGPRGVGKTTTARILARAVNQLAPATSTDNHLDIIEIDAASNRRIDEIRELRDKVHIAPAKCRYKVYIIDEVHMLTTEAFNALLKTLEEPPRHAIFILATTEPHKLPDTIISRTQRHNFRALNPELIAEHLREVAGHEKIDIEAEATMAIARAAEGSVRDGLSLLDQVASISGAKITAEDVAKALGQTDWQAIEDILTQTLQGAHRQLLDSLQQLWVKGIEPRQVVEQLIVASRQHLLDSVGQSPASQIKVYYGLIRHLTSLPLNSPHLGVALEVVLLQQSAPDKNGGTAAESPSTSQTEAAAKPRHQPEARRSPAETTAKPRPAHRPAQTTKSRRVGTRQSGDKSDHWLKTLSLIRNQNNSLYALLRSAEADLSDHQLKLTFRFQFHKKRVEEARNLQVVADALKRTTGEDIKITAKAKTAPSSTSQQAGGDVENILQVFGGEVIQ